MADGHDDDVFVMENGLITNQNVPLILEHDLEGGEEGADNFPDFLLEDEQGADNFPDFLLEDDQAVEDEVEGGDEGAVIDQGMFLGLHMGFPPGIAMLPNGVHNPESSSSSGDDASTVVFDQGAVLGASSPAARDLETSCYVNECFQSDGSSELSEFVPSVEIEPDALTVSFNKRPGVAGGTGQSSKDSSVENKEAATTSTATAAKNTIEASTGTFYDNSELFRYDPPNSAADSGQSLHLRYRNRTNPQVQQLRSPDRPSTTFRKCGNCMFVLALALLLAILACLEGLIPNSSLTTIIVLWGLAILATIGCYVRSCWEERNLVPEAPIVARSSYGSTSTTGPGLSRTA